MRGNLHVTAETVAYSHSCGGSTVGIDPVCDGDSGPRSGPWETHRTGGQGIPGPQVEDVSAPDEKTLTIRFWQAPTILNPYLGSSQMDRDAAAITLEPRCPQS